MKLFLSSYQIGNNPSELVRLLAPRRRAALILNASDVFGDLERPAYLAKYQKDFEMIGIASEEIDLRKYFAKQGSLESDLDRFDLIWVTGGNTFALRRAMFASGFDKLLPKILNNGDVVYGGFSAGICVTSPSLKWIHLADEPERVPAGYSQEVIWDGLGLIDFYIVPHYRSQHPESEMMEGVVEYLKLNNMPYEALKDGEALIVEDGSYRILK